MDQLNPLNKPSKFQLPNHKTVVTVGSAFFAVALISSLQKAPFPLSFLHLLVVAVDAWFHEFGHSVAGWLFGHVSIPLLMLSWIFPRSIIVQVSITTMLAAACVLLWRRKSEWFYLLLIFTIVATIIAFFFIGYTEIIINYMGHGGAVTFGGILLYLSLTYKSDDLIKQWLVAFMGWCMIVRNIAICYPLIISNLERDEYRVNKVFGFDNDFAKIQDATGILVQQTAAFTIIYAIIVVVTAVVLTMFPKQVLAAEKKPDSYELLK